MTLSAIVKYPLAGLLFALATFVGLILVNGSPAFLVLDMDRVNLSDRSGPDLSTPIKVSPSRSRVSLSEYSRRPLFSEDRRPAPIAAEDTADAALRLKVVGLSISSRTSIAVLERVNRTQLRVELGNEVDGWTVTDILPDRVTFQRDGDEIEIQLSKPGE